MYRRFLRPGWFVGHFLVLLAVLVCLRLGVWQWHRTHDPDGTVQNLGYAFLWPVFGGAFIYMWVRFLQLEVIKDAQDEDELTALAAGTDSVDDPADALDPDPTGLLTADPAPSVRDQWSGEPDDRPAEPVGQFFEPAEPMKTDLTPGDVRSDRAARRPRTPVVGFSVGTVGDENQDQDPELAAYNRALAALAEKDRRRAR